MNNDMVAHAWAHGREAKGKKEFKAWLEKGEGMCSGSYKYDRVNGDYFTIKGDLIVTSQGATCPVDHAVAALKFWESRKDGEGFKEYHTNGHTIHLGIFKLGVIDPHGNVRAGCHMFRRVTIEKFIATYKARL